MSDHEDPKALAFNPFNDLAVHRVELPSGPIPPPSPTCPPPGAPPRAVLRLERRLHGGKEVTVVERLGLKAVELECWLKDLRRSLGCGGSIRGEDLLLQGDQRERLRTLLAARGVKKVTG